MTLPRISDSLLSNNIWLLALAIGAALLLAWLGIYGSTWLLARLVRASRVRALMPVADRLGKLGAGVAIISSVLIILGAIGLLGYSVWRNHDLQPWFDRLGERLTLDLLQVWGMRAALLLGLGICTAYVWRLGRALAPRLGAVLEERPLLAESRETLARMSAQVPAVCAWVLLYVAVHSLVQAWHVVGYAAWTAITICHVALAIFASRLLVQLGFLALESGDRYLGPRVAATRAALYYDKTILLLPLARRLLAAIVYLGCAIIIVRRFETLRIFGPFGEGAIQVLLVFFGSKLLIELLGALIDSTLLGAARQPTPAQAPGAPGYITTLTDESAKRRTTLVALLQRFVRVVIYALMVMIMLVLVGVDPLPLLAGAGIIGFAIGLASQKILEDLICGFFMLFEDQLLIGDYVRIGDTEGMVEECHLRVTRIRDRYGRVHTMRNGDIANVINYSRGWTKAVVEMSVAYEADIDQVVKVMTQVGESLHEALPEMVLAPSEVVGIEALDESCLRVRSETRVHAGCHYHVKRLHQELLFKAFVAHELEIPYPKAIEFSEAPPTSPPTRPALAFGSETERET